MIIHFHPKEIESKKGIELINILNKDNNHKIVHASEKTVKEWQAIISSSEKLILVAPVYWWGASYVFDKWIQDVFAYGFAYKYTDKGAVEGLLSGRTFELHMTHGMPHEYAIAMRENISKRMIDGIFGFCNAHVIVKYYDINQSI